MIYKKFHLPVPIFCLPSSKFTSIDERAHIRFPPGDGKNNLLQFSETDNEIASKRMDDNFKYISLSAAL